MLSAIKTVCCVFLFVTVCAAQLHRHHHHHHRHRNQELSAECKGQAEKCNMEHGSCKGGCKCLSQLSCAPKAIEYETCVNACQEFNENEEQISARGCWPQGTATAPYCIGSNCCNGCEWASIFPFPGSCR